MEKYKRKAVYSSLKPFVHLSKEDDYIEVCEWNNGEGFDVEVGTILGQRFQLTWGEYDLIKKMIKKLQKND